MSMDSDQEDFYYSSADDDVAVEDDVYDDVTEEDVYDDDEKPYTILKGEETIKQLQQNDILEVSSVLALSRGIACTLLLRSNWSVSSVFEEWFADEVRVRAAISTNPTQKQPKKKNIYCKICMETVKLNTMLSSTTCGHLFCWDCWTKYIAVSINDGAGCLALRCPEPKCAAAVGHDMVEAAAEADDELKRKFHRCFYRSYVEASRNRKWCPGPGCDYAVEFEQTGLYDHYDVVCECGHKFCWRCTEAWHRPLSCDTVAKWAEKNSSEEENNTWLLAFTKPCPKCHKKIEKNEGCNHMTCKCGYQFCWLCLAKWHKGSSSCNTYDEEKEKARYTSMESARLELKRYAHYFERWANNHKSREKALEDTVRAKNEHLPKLSLEQKTTENDLNFVVEAWDQIVECRRVLKWSYAYGYYIEADKEEKKTFFEYLQGQAEAALERLHHCAEKEIAVFINPDDDIYHKPSGNFTDFRMKLHDLTAVTGTYFQNLVRALESDLSEVEGKKSS